MFKDNMFENWLDTKSKEIVQEFGSGKSLSSEDIDRKFK